MAGCVKNVLTAENADNVCSEVQTFSERVGVDGENIARFRFTLPHKLGTTAREPPASQVK